jgi:peptidyl-prolyl cis-trans isomerase C
MRTLCVLFVSACAFAQTPATTPPKAPAPKAATPITIAPGGPATVGAPAATVTPETAGASPAPAADPNQVVASVGDLKITRAQFELFLAGLPDELKNMRSGAGKRNLIRSVIEVHQIAAEARRVQFDKDKKTAAQLEFQYEQVLANYFLRAEMAKAMADEGGLRAWYERNLPNYQQLKARHILIRTPGSVVPLRAGATELTEEEALAKAKEVREKLVAGADFAEIAGAVSDDAGSAARGGELGFFGPGQMVAPFEQAAWVLRPGEISQPVKSDFGYHIIQLQEQRIKPFEEVKEEVREKSYPEFRLALLDEIRKKYRAWIDEDYFAR